MTDGELFKTVHVANSTGELLKTSVDYRFLHILNCLPFSKRRQQHTIKHKDWRTVVMYVVLKLISLIMYQCSVSFVLEFQVKREVLYFFQG